MLANAIKEVEKQNTSVALVTADGRIFTDNGKSVRPLHRLFLQHRSEFAGGFVADRVIGKAAASILVAGGVKEAFGFLMSEAGLNYLEAHGIKASYATLTPHILNRAETDLCPMEKTVKDLDDPEECVAAITDFIARTPYPFG